MTTTRDVQDRSGCSAEGSGGENDLMHRIGDELDRRLAKHRTTTEGGLLGLRQDLKARHAILYVALAFLGSTLCWYAVWKIVQAVPVLRNPIVALIAGVVLLGVTAGYRKTLL